MTLVNLRHTSRLLHGKLFRDPDQMGSQHCHIPAIIMIMMIIMNSQPALFWSNLKWSWWWSSHSALPPPPRSAIARSPTFQLSTPRPTCWGAHWWSGDGGGDDCDVGGLQPSTWFEDIDSWCSLRWNLVLVKLWLSSHLVHLAHCLKAQALRVKHSNSKPRQHLSFSLYLMNTIRFTSRELLL